MSGQTAEQELTRVLVENGLGNPDASLHGWRCRYPEQYGQCNCLAELVADLAPLLAEAERRGAEKALEPLLEWVMSGHPAWPGCAPWYRDRERAEAMLRDCPHPDAYIQWRYRSEWTRADAIAAEPRP